LIGDALQAVLHRRVANADTLSISLIHPSERMNAMMKPWFSAVICASGGSSNWPSIAMLF
jgi:hypothetical protein